MQTRSRHDRPKGTARSSATCRSGSPICRPSIDAAVALVENGVDIVELGLPYSDPVMDGTVIQQATQASLAGGFKLHHAFEAVAAISARVDAPLLLMTYWNPVLQYGVDRFADDLRRCRWRRDSSRRTSCRMRRTPGSPHPTAPGWTGCSWPHRRRPTSGLRSTIAASRGFVYAVSTMGITGARTELDEAARTLVGRLRDLGRARDLRRSRHLDRGAGR